MQSLRAWVLGCALALTPYLAHAESVYVKYIGQLELVSYDCTYTSSSFVNRVCYNPSNQTTVVLLKSTYYMYCRMPESTVSQWLNASSKGRYYSSYVKDKFRC